jgi:hypothetical protein
VSRRLLIILPAVLVVLCLGVVVAIGAGRDGRLFSTCNFDRATWDRGRAEQDSARAFDILSPEVEDLVKCDGIVYGKTRGKIEALLGAPDRSTGRKWTYSMGIPARASEYGALRITFLRGKVAYASVPGEISRPTGI